MRKPVGFVVDGSNAAWLVGDRPRLSNIDRLTETLRHRHPEVACLVVCDASLFHRLDPAERDEWSRRTTGPAFEIAPPRTDADELILRRARETSAIVVSRDRFAQWSELRLGVPLLEPRPGPDGAIGFGPAIVHTADRGLRSVDLEAHLASLRNR